MNTNSVLAALLMTIISAICHASDLEPLKDGSLQGAKQAIENIQAKIKTATPQEKTGLERQVRMIKEVFTAEAAYKKSASNLEKAHIKADDLKAAAERDMIPSNLTGKRWEVSAQNKRREAVRVVQGAELAHNNAYARFNSSIEAMRKYAKRLEEDGDTAGAKHLLSCVKGISGGGADSAKGATSGKVTTPIAQTRISQEHWWNGRLAENDLTRNSDDIIFHSNEEVVQVIPGQGFLVRTRTVSLGFVACSADDLNHIADGDPVEYYCYKEQFVHQYTSASGAVRTIPGSRLVPGCIRGTGYFQRNIDDKRRYARAMRSLRVEQVLPDGILLSETDYPINGRDVVRIYYLTGYPKDQNVFDGHFLKTFYAELTGTYSYTATDKTIRTVHKIHYIEPYSNGPTIKIIE